MIPVEDIRRWVERFDPMGDQRAMESQAATLALLDTQPWPGARGRFDPGHVTASGLVLSPDGSAVLLVFHQRLGRWLQPGGHLEAADETIVGAARREVLEETGVTVDGRVDPVLVRVDVHEIPPARGEPPHYHHDLMFRFVAAEETAAQTPDGERAAWCPFDRLAELGVDAPLLRGVERARLLRREP